MNNRPWEKMPRVLCITGDPDITTAWRIWWPCAELTGRGYIADFTKYGDLNLYWDALEQGRYNIVVTPRMGFDSSLSEQAWYEIVGRLRSYGIAWIWETDDDLFSDAFLERAVAVNPAEAKESLGLQRQSRLRVIQHADAITVATPVLAEHVRTLTGKPVYVVPNGIKLELFDYRLSYSSRAIPPLTVGWSGGPRLESDLEPLYEVWAKLAELRPEVRFLVQGWCPPKMREALNRQHLITIGGVDFDQHPAMLKNFDVLCCVVGDDIFNRAKSPVKYFEANLAGAATVVGTQVYGEYAQQAGTYVASNTQEWLEHIVSLVDDPELRQQHQQQARELIVNNFTTHQTYPLWLDAWANVLN